MSDADILKLKLTEWKACIDLGRNDSPSIGNQIADMLWRSAFYRSINQSRRFLHTTGGNKRLANGALHQFIDEGYVALAAGAIRRLLDRYPLSGPRGVYSVSALLEDIHRHADLLNRSAVLMARDLIYDYEPVMAAAVLSARNEARAKGESAYFISRAGWADAEWWHRAMDELCSITPKDRRPDDRVPPGKLKKLIDDLHAEGEGITEWVNKHLAHAASPASLKLLDPEHRALSLAKLWRAERMIYRVVNFVSVYFIDGRHRGGVPAPQFDVFENLTRPFVDEDALPAMRQEWDEHKKEIEACGNWTWDEPLMNTSDAWSDDP